VHFSISGAHPNATNRGLGALSIGSIEAILSAVPSARISFLDFEENPTCFDFHFKGKNHSVEYIDLRYNLNVLLRNNVFVLCIIALIYRCLPIKFVKRILRSRFPTIERIMSVDHVLSIAGGDSFAEIYNSWVLLYVSMPQILCILLGKKLIQLPQTYGPYRTWLGKKLVHFILKNSEAVYSRDRDGIAYLRELFGNDPLLARTHFSYDMGFILQPEKPQCPEMENLVELKQTGTFFAGFNVSGLLYKKRFTGKNEFGLKIDYKEMVDAIVNEMVCSMKYTVVLVPHVFGNGYENDGEAAIAIYNELSRAYGKKIQYIDREFSCKEIKFIIGLCDFFCGSRMHACIGALSQNVPTVPLAYSKKFVGVMKTLDLDWIVADLTVMTSVAEIIDKIRDVHGKRVTVCEHLRQRMPAVKTAIQGIFKETV
jgi:Uncharacterized conserved protein